jgi:hypothetical protein
MEEISFFQFIDETKTTSDRFLQKLTIKSCLAR